MIRRVHRGNSTAIPVRPIRNFADALQVNPSSAVTRSPPFDLTSHSQARPENTWHRNQLAEPSTTVGLANIPLRSAKLCPRRQRDCVGGCCLCSQSLWAQPTRSLLLHPAS